MEGQPTQTTSFGQILPVIEVMGNADMGGHDHRNKRCCDCNCDCGQTLVNTFADIVGEKLHHIYEHISVQQKQIERVENLLMSVVSIKYPELKRKIHTPGGIDMNNSVDLDDDDQNDTPKKRRRIYSHDISNKINTHLEPLFEDSWKISKDKEREIGQKLAEEINVEHSEGITIVKSFWHRSRGNSKRLYTQLDDYRAGLEHILSLDPEKKQEALARFKLESEEVLRSDIAELGKILDDMKKKGSGRTAVKGKKNLKKIPDTPIKTLKGRASSLCNHFYAMVNQGGMDVLGGMDDSPSPSNSPTMSHTLHPHPYHNTQPMMGGMQLNMPMGQQMGQS